VVLLSIAASMQCACGARLQRCQACGARLLSLDELLAHTERVKLSIGRTYAGRTIGALAETDPEILNRWAKTKGSTPQMKLCSAYARVQQARELLEVALKQSGSAFRETPEPRRPAFLPPMAPDPPRRPLLIFVKETIPGTLVTTVGTVAGAVFQGSSTLCESVATRGTAIWAGWKSFVQNMTKVFSQVSGLAASQALVSVMPTLLGLGVLIAFFPRVWIFVLDLLVAIVVELFFGTAVNMGQRLGDGVVLGAGWCFVQAGPFLASFGYMGSKINLARNLTLDAMLTRNYSETTAFVTAEALYVSSAGVFAAGAQWLLNM
jgi:hypothetical protein